MMKLNNFVLQFFLFLIIHYGFPESNLERLLAALTIPQKLVSCKLSILFRLISIKRLSVKRCSGQLLR